MSNQEILDDLEFVEERGNAIKRGKIVPIMILWIGILLNILFGRIDEVTVILALLGLTLASIVSYSNWRKGVVITGVLYLLSIINVLIYYPITLKIGIELNGLFLGIDLVMIGLSLIYLRINEEEIRPIIQNLLSGTKEEQVSQGHSRVNGFKKRFTNRTTEELSNMTRNDHLVEEARQAARELIDERKKLDPDLAKELGLD